MKRKLQFLKTLLVAAGLCAGASDAWGDRVYFNDFESYATDIANGDLTIIGNGEFIVDADARFGHVFHNDPALQKAVRTNYLKLATSALTHSGTSKAMTIGFWVNKKNAADFWDAPIFTAYGSLDNANGTSDGWPMFAAWTKGTLQLNCWGWTNFADEQNDAGTNYYGTFYLDDSNWHYYTITLTTTSAKVYIDGVLVNSWTEDGTDGHYIEGLFNAGAENVLPYVCLGGCQPWNQNVIDPAFAFDDIAIYDEALTQAQIKSIIGAKMPIISLPASYDFTTWNATNAWPRATISPFDAGTVEKGTNVTALQFANTTATAYFDANTTTDGRQAYAIAANEKVTFTINALHGYLGIKNQNAVFSIVNSDGVALASYSYNCNDREINDVKIGGATVDGFTSFDFASYYNATQNANGLTGGGKPYLADAQYNPVITISVSGTGSVTLNFTRTTPAVSKEFVGILDGSVTKDLAKIVIADGITNADRSYCIQQLSIATETVSEANVTYKFVDTSDNDLSALVADKIAAATIGDNISEVIPSSYTASFLSGDENTKYVYSTYSCTDETVQAGGSTVYLKFAPKAKFTYTKRAMNGEEVLNATLATGNAYDGESVTLSWPKYIENDGKWYVTTANYQSSATSAATEDVSYTLSDVTQYLEGTSSNWAGTSDSHGQYSGGVAYRGLSSAKTMITAAETGVYSLIYAVCSGNTKTARTLDVYKNSVDEENKLQDQLSITWSYNYINSTGTKTIENVTLAAGDQILFKPGDTNVILDYVALAKKTAEKATIPSSTYGTIASAYALDCSNLPTGVTAYKVSSLSASSVTLEPVTEAVAPGTGLILSGTAGTYSIPVVASGTDISATNKLKAAVTAYDCTANEVYILKGGEFHLVNTASTVPAGKAYLLASDFPGGAPSLNFVFGGETTGINSVEAGEVLNGAFYNLNGQRVAAPGKGLYIVNGKKVIIK